MPVVTTTRVGSLVGTGVFDPEKLRIPVTASAKPMRIAEPATIGWARSILRTGNLTASR
jgi:hypothetical protein